MTSIHRLEENVGSAEIERYSADLNRIEAAVSRIEIRGARYRVSAQKMADRYFPNNVIKQLVT